MPPLPGKPSGRPETGMNIEPEDGYSELEWELWSRIGHLAGPDVPSRDFDGAVIGSPDLQSPMTLRKVERAARNGRRAA